MFSTVTRIFLALFLAISCTMFIWSIIALVMRPLLLSFAIIYAIGLIFTCIMVRFDG